MQWYITLSVDSDFWMATQVLDFHTAEIRDFPQSWGSHTQSQPQIYHAMHSVYIPSVRMHHTLVSWGLPLVTLHSAYIDI